MLCRYAREWPALPAICQSKAAAAAFRWLPVIIGAVTPQCWTPGPGGPQTQPCAGGVSIWTETLIPNLNLNSKFVTQGPACCPGAPLVPYVGAMEGSTNYYQAVVDWQGSQDFRGPITVRTHLG